MRRQSSWKLVGLMLVMALLAIAFAAPPASPAMARAKSKVYKIGMVSAGDVTDHGYYQALADRVRKFAKSHGWPKPIIVPKVAFGDAAQVVQDLCTQGIDFGILGTADMLLAVPVLELPPCDQILWYADGGPGLPQSNAFTQSTYDYAEIYYAAGVAAAQLMNENGKTKAGFIGGPPLDFVKVAATGFEIGLKSVIPGATVVTTYTGDFNDSAKAVEAANAQISEGVGFIVSFLGGAGDAVAREADSARVAWSTPGVDRCGEKLDPAVSVIFDPGRFILPQLRLLAKGKFKEGKERHWSLGVDPVPTIKICVPKRDQQEQVDKVMADIASHKIDPPSLVQAALGGA